MQKVRIAADNVVSSGHLRIYTPSSASEYPEICNGDFEFFRKNKGRHMFIRESRHGEFDCGFELLFGLHLNQAALTMPTLWALVNGDDSLYFSIPVYRGQAFFHTKNSLSTTIADVDSDQATRFLVAEMYGRGGVESESFEKWKADALKAIADHNLKQLAPDGKTN